MKVLYLLLFFTTLYLTTSAQNIDRSNIAVQFEIAERTSPEHSKFTYKLIFNNLTGDILRNSNWKIYFNMSGHVSSPKNDKEYMIRRVAGVLYEISPSNHISSAPHNSKIEVFLQASGPIINFSDIPNGFFIYYIDSNQYFNLKNPTVVRVPKQEEMQRSSLDILPMQTPELIFNANQKITQLSDSDVQPILPTPLLLQAMKGKHLINANYIIDSDTLFANEQQFLKEALSNLLRPTTATAIGKIVIKKIKLENKEAYKLAISEKEIVIEAAGQSGCFYAIQSLLQLVPLKNYTQKQEIIELKSIKVEDTPRFKYRAIHLDVSRNFQPKEQILKLLDAMAIYKLNTFHLHFSDDDGWRIEIPSLPELTEVGAKRGITDPLNMLTPTYGSGAFTTNSFGSGFYKRNEFIEILKYAAERHIEVIPEIETPGHARAAVKSMEARYRKYAALNDTVKANEYRLIHPDDHSKYITVQYLNDNIMDVSLPSTYAFITRVVDDLRLMYREAGAILRTVHLGGDEVPAGVWEKSPAFVTLKEKNKSIETTDDLWYYYFSKVNQILKERNLFLSGWEEAGIEFVKTKEGRKMVPNPLLANENFHLDVWNNVPHGGQEDLAYALANAGYKVVLGCVTHNYFDQAVYKSYDEPGFYWGSFVDIDKPFSFIPFDYFKNLRMDRFGRKISPEMMEKKIRLTDFGKSNIIGLKGLLWTETVTSTSLLHYKMYPKLISLAERAWASSPEWAEKGDDNLYDEAFNQFVNQLGQRELKRLDVLNGGYQYRIPSPGIKVDKEGKIHVNMQIPGFALRYTVNGEEPSASSPLYKKPIRANGVFKVKAFNSTNTNNSNSSTIKIPKSSK